VKIGQIGHLELKLDLDKTVSDSASGYLKNYVKPIKGKLSNYPDIKL
jgi:hypothetical protein